MIQSKNDPTPKEISLGMWNSSVCDEYPFMDVYNKIKPELQLDGRIARLLIPMKTPAYGYIRGWKILIGDKAYNIVLKASDNLVILDGIVSKSTANYNYKVYYGNLEVRYGKPINILGNLIYCGNCSFTNGLKEGKTTSFHTNVGREMRKIKRIWDHTLLEIDQELLGTEIEEKGISQPSEKDETISFTKIKGEFEFKGNLVYGLHTEFFKLQENDHIAVIPKSVYDDDVLFIFRHDFHKLIKANQISKVSDILSHDLLVINKAICPVETQADEKFGMYLFGSGKAYYTETPITSF